MLPTRATNALNISDKMIRATYPLTPKRRFLAGLLGGRVDCTPVGSVTSVANVEQMEITGAFFPDVHFDGEKMALLAAGAHTILERPGRSGCTWVCCRLGRPDKHAG